jgi:hypothetical protein
MARGGRGGRLHAHQRDVDDSVDIINADIVIDAEHADDIIATEQSAMNDKTRKEYRNRINGITSGWR